MCSCTKPLIFVFIIFIFLQLKYRWERDFNNIPKWMVQIEGQLESIHMKQSVLIPFDNYTIVEGDVFSEVFLSKSLKAKDILIVKLNAYIYIESAPMSYHYIMCSNKKYFTQLNRNGKGSIHFKEIINMNTHDQLTIEYLYEYSDIHSESNIFFSNTVTNGFI